MGLYFVERLKFLNNHIILFVTIFLSLTLCKIVLFVIPLQNHRDFVVFGVFCDFIDNIATLLVLW